MFGQIYTETNLNNTWKNLWKNPYFKRMQMYIWKKNILISFTDRKVIWENKQSKYEEVMWKWVGYKISHLSKKTHYWIAHIIDNE